MILHHVVLHLGQSKLEAVVEYPEANIRRIVFAWQTKDQTDVPVDAWWTAVKAEAEFQRTREHEEATGRKRI